MKYIVVALIGLGALLSGFWLWNSTPARIATGRWTFTQSIADDRGTYFRLQVRVAYKGEPVEFDIVVGCKVRRIKYKDGRNTTEVGMVPAVFGKRMPDNKGLVVRPPDACRTSYINEGWIPDDILPVIVLYDNADTLAFGTAYMSEDAYHSPLADLRFEGAKILPATRVEFETFRSSQTNLVSRNTFHSARMGPGLLKDRGLEPTRPFGNHCHAYERYRIPEGIRDQVRSAWPSDRPRYWDPGPMPSFAGALWDAQWQRDVAGPSRSRHGWARSGEWPAAMGVARSTGGGQIGSPQDRSANAWGPSYYPVYSDNNAGRDMPARLEDWPEHIRRNPEFVGQKVDYRDGLTRGFAYCYQAPIASSEYNSLDKERFGKAISAWASSQVLHLVDNETIKGSSSRLADNVALFIERDEYFFRISQFYLEGTRGDV